MRIDSLPSTNVSIQGPRRRAWLQQHSPQHIQKCHSLIAEAIRLRDGAASRSSLIAGAGACTEVPLQEIARASDEVVLADLDLVAMQRGREEVPVASLRKRMRFVQCDLTAGVSNQLERLLRSCDWRTLAAQGGARAVFDAAASCLEKCVIADPPQIYTLRTGDFGLVVSSMLLSQLFSYPLLDVLDSIQAVVPDLLEEQERHRRYQDAAQAFRIRIIKAHLHLLQTLLDSGGIAVLLSDVRGFAFTIYGTDHDDVHRHWLPLVPRVFPDLIQEVFTVLHEERWEWLADLPSNERPGRGYEVYGYILSARK